MDAKRQVIDRSVGLRTFSWARFAVMMALIGTPCIACAWLCVRQQAPDRAQGEPAAGQTVSRPLVIVIPSPLVVAQHAGVHDAAPTPSHATTSHSPGGQKADVHDGCEQSSAPPYVAQSPKAQPSEMPNGESTRVPVAAPTDAKDGVAQTPTPLPSSVVQMAASNPAAPQLPPLPSPGKVPSAPVELPPLPGSVIQTAGSNPALPQLPPLPGPGEVPSAPVGPPTLPVPAILPPAPLAVPSGPAPVTRTDDAPGTTAGAVLPLPDGMQPPASGPSLVVPAPESLPKDDNKPSLPNAALELPAPNTLPAAMPPSHPLPPSLWSSAADMPQPTEEELNTIRDHVEGVVDPKCVLDVIQGRTCLLKLKKPARSVQVVGTKVINCTPVNGREIAIQARAVGTCVLRLTFGEADTSQEVEVRYLVRVFPALTAREPYEANFRALEAEIAGMFPESKVQLKLVGEAVLVTGQVHEARDAAAIEQLVIANTPWAERHAAAGPGKTLTVAASSSPNVINRLQIAHAGTHQVTLKVAVVEMSRSALWSLCGKGAGALPDTNHAAGAIVPVVYDVSDSRMSAAWAAPALSGVKLANGTDGRPLPESRLIVLHGQPANLVATVQCLVTAPSDKTAGEQRPITLGLQGGELRFTPVCIEGESLRLTVAATPSQPGTGRHYHSTFAVRKGQMLAFTGLLPPSGWDYDSQRSAGWRSIFGRFMGVEQPAPSERQTVILLLPEAVGSR